MYYCENFILSAYTKLFFPGLLNEVKQFSQMFEDALRRLQSYLFKRALNLPNTCINQTDMAVFFFF